MISRKYRRIWEDFFGGTKWWHRGTERKRSMVSPSNDWLPGKGRKISIMDNSNKGAVR